MRSGRGPKNPNSLEGTTWHEVASTSALAEGTIQKMATPLVFLDCDLGSLPLESLPPAMSHVCRKTKRYLGPLLWSLGRSSSHRLRVPTASSLHPHASLGLPCSVVSDVQLMTPGARLACTTNAIG